MSNAQDCSENLNNSAPTEVDVDGVGTDTQANINSNRPEDTINVLIQRMVENMLGGTGHNGKNVHDVEAVSDSSGTSCHSDAPELLGDVSDYNLTLLLKAHLQLVELVCRRYE